MSGRKGKQGGGSHDMVKAPVLLAKRLADATDGTRRFEVQVPEDYEAQGLALDSHRGEHFVILGPFQDSKSLKAALK